MPPPDDHGGRRPGATPADRHYQTAATAITHHLTDGVCQWTAIDPLALAAALAWAVAR